MKYKELIMTEQSTGKKTVLYENEEFKNFDYLSNLMMKYGYSEKDYENLGDDIMSGIDHFDIIEYGNTIETLLFEYIKYPECFEIHKIPEMPDGFTKITYHGYTIKLNQYNCDWYYGKSSDGSLCVTSTKYDWKKHDKIKMLVQRDYHGKFEAEWWNIVDDNGNLIVKIMDDDMEKVVADIKDNRDHAMDFEDWLLSTDAEECDVEWTQENYDKDRADEIIRNDYNDYLNMHWKYSWLVRTVAENMIKKGM